MESFICGDLTRRPPSVKPRVMDGPMGMVLAWKVESKQVTTDLGSPPFGKYWRRLRISPSTVLGNVRCGV